MSVSAGSRISLCFASLVRNDGYAYCDTVSGTVNGLTAVKRPKIVILTYYRYPCREPVLENVFARILGEKFDLTWLLQGNRAKRRIVHWYRSKVVLARGLAGRRPLRGVINQVLALVKLKTALALVKGQHPDVVIVRDMPAWGLLFGLLKKRRRYRLWFQYTAPLGQMSLEYARIDKSAKRYWYRLQGWAYNRLIQKSLMTADLILPITEFHQKALIEENPGLVDRHFSVLSMGFDRRALHGSRKPVAQLEELRRDHHLIVYFGSLNFNRNPKFMIDVARELKALRPNFRLFLIGKTAGRREDQELNRYIHRSGLAAEIIRPGYIERQRLYDYLAYFAVSISAIPPTPPYLISSPTKMYESMGLGIPVIANDEIYEQKKVITASNGGVLVNYNTAQFSAAIAGVLADPSHRRTLSRNAQQYVLAHYAYDRLAEGLAQRIEQAS